MIAGILLFYFYTPSLRFIYPASLLLLALYILVEWRNRQILSPTLSRSATLLYIMLILSFGMLRMQLNQYEGKSALLNLARQMPWEELTLQGDIIQVSQNSSGKIRWDVQVYRTEISDVVAKERYKARVLLEKAEAAGLGDRVSIAGTLIPIPKKRNPYDYDYAGYLSSRKLSIQLRLDSCLWTSPNNSKLRWVWWRAKALQLLRNNFDEQTYPIASALLLGYKQELDSEARLAFARAGLSHILAVSGLHVGFIVAPFWLCIPYFWVRKHGRILGFTLLLLLLWIYAGLTGFSASVMRASVMAAFLSYARLFHKNSNSINLTGAAALCILIIDPEQVLQIGFQLSFCAVLIILVLLPLLRSYMPYHFRMKWYSKPLIIICVSLLVQFGLYPLQVYYFGEVSLVSPIANALFVPFLSIAVPLSLVAMILTVLSPALAYYFNYPAYLFISFMHDFVIKVGNWDWAWTKVAFPGHMLFIIWLLVLATLASLRIPSLRFKYLGLLLITLCVAAGNRIYSKIKPAKISVTFLDVGQGDAALVQSPGGKNILIDSGKWSPGYNSGRSIIMPHLKGLGIDRLDALILSHPHADHIGGTSELIREVPIHKIYNSGFVYDSELYHTYLDLAEEKNIPISSARAGDTLGLDPSLLIMVLGPFPNTQSSDPNQHSVILKIQYGKRAFLFTGDAGVEQEKMAVSYYEQLLDSDVLKVGHHGSRSSSSLPFLRIVTPDIAVISLDDQNKFGHPHREALSRLKATKADLLFTSLEGAILFKADGIYLIREAW